MFGRFGSEKFQFVYQSVANLINLKNLYSYTKINKIKINNFGRFGTHCEVKEHSKFSKRFFIDFFFNKIKWKILRIEIVATPNANNISEPIENSINQTRTENFIPVKVITQRKSPRNIHARVNSTLGAVVREVRSIFGPRLGTWT